MMSKLPSGYLTAECSCGKVKIEVFGPPIMHTACYCNDCQVGGHQIEALLGAAPVLDSDGGTPFLLYRRDRVSSGSVEQFLRPYKIKASSPTSRLVTTCCNSAMYLNFEKGHWLALYRNRFKGDVPPLEMRVCTKSKRNDVDLPSNVPNHAGYSLSFFAKLIAAWVPMLLRR
jgi:hypothetical protein